MLNQKRFMKALQMILDDLINNAGYCFVDIKYWHEKAVVKCYDEFRHVVAIYTYIYNTGILTKLY